MGLEEIDILPGVIVGFISHPLSDSDVHSIYARTAISAAELNCSSEGTLKVPHSPTNSDLIHWLEMFEKWWERLSNSLFMSTPTKMRKNRIYSQFFLRRNTATFPLAALLCIKYAIFRALDLHSHLSARFMTTVFSVHAGTLFLPPDHTHREITTLVRRVFRKFHPNPSASSPTVKMHRYQVTKIISQNSKPMIL